MIKAVIFDMYETLITLYESPNYFGTQIARDLGMPEDKFQAIWGRAEHERSIGKISLEAILRKVLLENNCYTDELFSDIYEKRVNSKKECFKHLHKDIIPMLSALKNRGILVGLISNCFSEEAQVIRNSELFTYFDAVCLSYEEGLSKPDEKIYYRCMDKLKVNTKECIYIGDGGSFELETAKKLGMKAIQAVWYLKDGTTQPVGRKDDFEQVEAPLDILSILEE